MKRTRSNAVKSGGLSSTQQRSYKRRKAEAAREQWGYTYSQRKSALGEIKMVDVASVTLKPGLTAAPAAILLNGLEDGSAYWNRIGRKINMTSYTIEGSFIPNDDAVAGPRPTFHIRYLVVYDRQPNGTLPNFSDILTSRTKTGTAVSTVYAQVNEANKDRFLVLENKLITVPASELTATTEFESTSWGCRNLKVLDWDPVNIKTYRKLPALPVSYSASTGDIGDIRTGSLFLMLCHNSGEAGECPLQFIGSTRLRFADVN